MAASAGPAISWQSALASAGQLSFMTAPCARWIGRAASLGERKLRMPTRFSFFVFRGLSIALVVLLQLTRTLPAIAGGGRCAVKALFPLIRMMDPPMGFQKVWTGAHRDPVRGGWRDPFQGEMAILAEGEIDLGTAERFQKFLQENQLPAATAVWLSSPGGVLG